MNVSQNGKLYFHYVKVTGTGDFPVDMLRYDACYPRTTEDALKILGGYTFAFGERRTVELVRVSDSRSNGFTPGRWASFGWRVE